MVESEVWLRDMGGAGGLAALILAAAWAGLRGCTGGGVGLGAAGGSVIGVLVVRGGGGRGASLLPVICGVQVGLACADAAAAAAIVAAVRALEEVQERRESDDDRFESAEGFLPTVGRGRVDGAGGALSE